MITNIPDTFFSDKEKVLYTINLLLYQIKILQANIPNNKKIKSTDLEKMIISYLFHHLEHPQELLIIFSPITVKIWFNIFFKNKKYINKPNIGRPPIHIIIKKIICELKLKNNYWGYTRIKDELRKLKIKVCRTTIKNILKKEFPEFLKQNNKWKQFLNKQFKKHIYKVISCDFKKIIDSNGSSLFVLFFMAISTKEILHANVTAHPTKKWIHQQLREVASLIENKDFFLVRDNDMLFKQVDFDQFNIASIKIPRGQPEKNAVIERFIGSFQYEVLRHYKDQLDYDLLYKITKDYTKYYNRYRPHQGLNGLTIPEHKKIFINKLKNKTDIILNNTNEDYLFYDIQEKSMLNGLLNHYYFDSFNLKTA